MEVTCNQPIDKAIPVEVMAAMLTLMERFGVPGADRLFWAYSQKKLMATLLAAYRQGNNDDRS